MPAHEDAILPKYSHEMQSRGSQGDTFRLKMNTICIHSTKSAPRTFHILPCGLS